MIKKMTRVLKIKSEGIGISLSGVEKKEKNMLGFFC